MYADRTVRLRRPGNIPAAAGREVNVMKMNPVVHFEMPAEDRKRMAEFYTKVFGWQTQMMGPDMGDYVVVTTTESDNDGPKKPGAINGGFYPKKPDWPAQYPSVVISVDDIDESMKAVADAGGKILGEPMDIPGVGRYVSFYDTEGNRVSMLKALPRMAVRPKSQ
jgi:predicted enzyme related to lactoylglutathione lyase